MKVLVCGGRDYSHWRTVHLALDDLHKATPITEVIQGGASGADAHADSWANKRGVRNSPVYADWDKHGKAAGPIRNKAMLGMKPDLVVAFPGGRGTADMMRQATAAGVKIIKVE